MVQFLIFLFFITTAFSSHAQKTPRMVKVDSGWAKTSVNTPIFRKNSLVTDGKWQYIAFYNSSGMVILGKRKWKSKKWILKQTNLKGNVADAHNVISIMVDGRGYLHMAWDHHNNRLHYVRSLKPGSLDMTEQMPMTGKGEGRVSYPEFYRLSNGSLLFFYRDGGSGNGSLVINHYDPGTLSWTQLHSNLISGEGQRNAYWQACVDARGAVHLSWVWRETPDVATNHDMAYAVSLDGGRNWKKSSGEAYQLPITATTAEYAARIPQKSELINQTSMFADSEGYPYIATYWREQGDSIPQYHLVYKSGDGWQTSSIAFRKTAFSLSGVGSKRIPVSRPQIIAWKNGRALCAALIFRDEERSNKVSVAVNKNVGREGWILKDLSDFTVGSWEPSYDTELWKDRGLLHLFVQNVEQVDGEGMGNKPPQMVQVLEWKPKKIFKQ